MIPIITLIRDCFILILVILVINVEIGLMGLNEWNGNATKEK